MDLLLLKSQFPMMTNEVVGPKHMNFVHLQLSRSPLPTFSQFISTLDNHKLRPLAYKEKRNSLITIWLSIFTKT